MEGSVTIPLDTFKNLESKARVLDLMESNDKFVIHRSSYGDYYVSIGDEANGKLVRDLSSAIQSRDAAIMEFRGGRTLGRKS